MDRNGHCKSMSPSLSAIIDDLIDYSGTCNSRIHQSNKVAILYVKFINKMHHRAICLLHDAVFKNLQTDCPARFKLYAMLKTNMVNNILDGFSIDGDSEWLAYPWNIPMVDI